MRDDQHNSDVHRLDAPAEWPLIYPYTAQYADKSKQEIVIIMTADKPVYGSICRQILTKNSYYQNTFLSSSTKGP